MGFNLLLLAGTSAFGLGSLLERAGSIRSGFFECYELSVEMVGSSPYEELCGFCMAVQEKGRQDPGEV